MIEINQKRHIVSTGCNLWKLWKTLNIVINVLILY